MSADPDARRAVELLIDEAVSLFDQGRYAEARAVAERAREASQELRDLGLEVHAARIEAAALSLLGDFVAALSRLSWILGVAQDPGRRAELARAGVEKVIAAAHIAWVAAARYLPDFEAEKLLAVLDAGEAYVRGIGKPLWRAGLLRQRANVLDNLGRLDAAIAAAEEGLTLAERATEPTPGATLGTHSWGLGDLLRQAGRYDDAATRYKAVLADERSHPGDRNFAHVGLARCHLATANLVASRRHAGEAVHLAEGMGDGALQPALETLIDVALAQDDLPAAHTAADRMLEGARRLNSSYNLYYALRDAAKVALAEKDGARARSLLTEAAPHAEAIDRSRGRTNLRDELARYLAEADALLTGT